MPTVTDGRTKKATRSSVAPTAPRLASGSTLPIGEPTPQEAHAIVDPAPKKPRRRPIPGIAVRSALQQALYPFLCSDTRRGLAGILREWALASEALEDLPEGDEHRAAEDDLCKRLHDVEHPLMEILGEALMREQGCLKTYGRKEALRPRVVWLRPGGARVA